MRLKGKTAIVTGSRRGIGRGIAEAFAKQGANIAVSDIDLKDCDKVVKEIEKKYKIKGLAVKCDVSNKAEIDNLIKQTIKKFGKLDILVNNAGIFPFVQFDKMSESDWNKVLNINLKSVFLCSQAAAKVMKPGSKIISISSIASFVGFPGLAHYCASKGGINGMTRALALELASRGINVNAVAPGAIDTPGASQSSIKKELAEKEIILKWLVKQNINTVDEVGRVMAEYYTNKDNLMKFVRRNKPLR